MTHDESPLQELVAAQFTQALDAIPDALAIFTAADSPIAARILYVNAAFVQLSGYTRSQLIDHSTLLLAGARPDLQHVRAMRDAAQMESFSTVTRKFRPDGVAYDVELWLSPLRDGRGAVTTYSASGTSVATRRRRQPAVARPNRATRCRRRVIAGTSPGFLESSVTRAVFSIFAPQSKVRPR